jgi:hypothetical protein
MFNDVIYRCYKGSKVMRGPYGFGCDDVAAQNTFDRCLTKQHSSTSHVSSLWRVQECCFDETFVEVLWGVTSSHLSA